jgi:hypothetical protein
VCYVGGVGVVCRRSGCGVGGVGVVCRRSECVM